MANKPQPPSLQDILRKRQQSEFVGRAQQVTDFRANLRYDVTDERRKFIFSISGQGGVGKTWLARRLRKIAEEFGAATALTDEAETDAPAAMGRIANQLEEQGHPLKTFSERYKVYRQRKQELEADPDAPQGLTAFVTRTVVDVGFDLLEHTPAGVVTKHLPREMLATQASEWAEFVRRKLANKDETRLVLEPIPVLTPLWLVGLAEIAQEHPLAIFLDTYERTCPFLDPWLREVLEGRHGIVPANIVWAISGRDALDDNDWAPYRGLVAAAALEPFSEEEAREYLGGKGITDPKIIEVILRLSGRLPLLVATLATQSPSDAEHIKDASDTAVVRFLWWVDDPAQRRAALHAALPRRLNQDILACLVDPAQAEALFAWLQTMPFMQKRGDYWEYHEVVRSAMLRHLRTQSPKTWTDLHRRLAEHYEAARDGLGLDEAQGRKDSAWQELALEALYHRLCQAPKANLSAAVNGFLLASKAQRTFRRRWAETMRHAGEDASADECAIWGTHLLDGVTAYDDDQYDKAISMFTAMLEYPTLEPILKPIALDWRGHLHYLADRYNQAIADLSEAIRLAPEVAEYWGDRGMANLWKGEYTAARVDFDRAIELETDNAYMLANRGETYRLMGEYAKALPDFDRAIELDPDYAWAIASRGATYHQMGEYAKALPDFDRAIELDPDYAWAITSRGATYRQMGEYAKALLDFDRVLKLDPQSAHWAHEQRGIALGKLRRFGEAIEAFQQAEQSDPACASCLTSRVEIYRQMGEFNEAFANLGRAIALDPNDVLIIAARGETYRQVGRWAEAIADFTCAIQLVSNDAAMLAGRGAAYLGAGEYESALRDFDGAIALDPDYTAGLALRGETYYLMGKYEQALADLTRAIQADADYAFALALRGRTYRQMDQFEEAISDLTRAIELKPDYDLTGGLKPNYIEVVALRGETYRQMDEFAKALTDFDHAIELDPDNTQVIAVRGDTYRQMGEFAKALPDFDRVLELDPQSAHWAHEQRGVALRELGRFEEAIDAFAHAEEIEPSCAPCLANRGETYHQMGEFAKALPDFDRAIELDPDNAWAIASRGDTLESLKRYEEASAAYARAIELEPTDPYYHNNLAGVYLACGRLDEAAAEYDKRIELSPDNALHANITLGIIQRHRNNEDEARGHFEKALSLWENARAAQVQTPAGLLENRAIALLCLGNQPDAFATLQEAFAAAQPGYESDPDDERYALLASAPHPPDGLDQFQALIRAEVQRRAHANQAQ